MTGTSVREQGFRFFILQSISPDYLLRNKSPEEWALLSSFKVFTLNDESVMMAHMHGVVCLLYFTGITALPL
jgi:hypothetical protein